MGRGDEQQGVGRWHPSMVGFEADRGEDVADLVAGEDDGGAGGVRWFVGGRRRRRVSEGGGPGLRLVRDVGGDGERR